MYTLTTTPHHSRFTALFWDHPGEPMPEENFWTWWTCINVYINTCVMLHIIFQ